MALNKEKIFLGGAALFFLAVYLWFPLTTPAIFNSPDETANYFFITQFAQNGDFFSPEPLNYFVSGALHPRSISWNGYTLAPQGFVGLPLLYGWLAKISGLGAVKFFTPLLAILGALAFYGIVKKIFGARAAMISFILLLMFPAYWYYVSRFLYPNVPFASFLLIAAWAAMNGALHRGGAKRYLMIFSIGLAAALAIRPVEFLWVLPLMALAFVFYGKNFSWHKLFYSALIMGFIAIPILANNLFLYGNVFGSGYTLKQPIGAVADFGGKGDGGAWSAISPYGLHLRAIAENINHIFIKYLWWFSAAVLLGFLISFFSKKRKETDAYFTIAALLSAWLVIYYGSGNFTDNPSGGITIGDSHFRYWLPVFIVMMPFAGVAAEKIIFRLRPFYKNIFGAAGLFLAVVFSVYAAIFSQDDGLLAVKNNLKNSYEVKTAVMDIVGPDGIIITGRQDKIFFPERRVLYAQKIADPQLFYNLKKLKNKNFYIYAIGPTTEEFYTLGNIARVYGFELKRIAIFGKEVLYKLERMDGVFAYLK